jgi:dihydropteroate synthase
MPTAPIAERPDLPAIEPSFAGGFDGLAEAPLEHLWLRPTGFLTGAAATAAIGGRQALPLAGGRLAFSLVEVLARSPSGAVVAALSPLEKLRGWAERRGIATAARVDEQLKRLSAPRARWAGLSLDGPLIMGIINVTPDSFSDGGAFAAAELAVARGRALMAAGADILDVGGESMRPGAMPVPPAVEIRRVEPVVRALAALGAVVSIDSRHAEVMEAALGAGARIINDVSAMSGDPGSLAVAARFGAPIVLMHMQGEPRTMQDDPSYVLASLDIVDYLASRVAACAAAGIARERIVVDPGIGFGKRAGDNLEIMGRLGLFHALGCGVLLGVSRKSLIGRIGGGLPPAQRLPGSIAAGLFGLGQGAQILRVHDVAETRQAVATWQAMVVGI